jgi:hypothetical protein
MWMFRIRKARKAYYDAAELVAWVAKIESKLERLGGIGGGIYEKYESLASKFPPEMKNKIIALGTARNNVVHGDPVIREKDKVFALCEEVDNTVTERMKEDGVSIMEGMGWFTILFVLTALAIVGYFIVGFLKSV